MVLVEALLVHNVGGRQNLVGPSKTYKSMEHYPHQGQESFALVELITLQKIMKVKQNYVVSFWRLALLTLFVL